MSVTEELTALYHEEYVQANRGRKSSSIRTKGYADKIPPLVRTLKRTREYQVSVEILENYHKQINNLYFCALKTHQNAQLQILEEEILPELVRLDLAMLRPEQADGIGEEFYEHIRTARKGAVCREALFALYHEYYDEILRQKILTMVPSRPELEFPDALAMKRHFILHVGPTNSGKTFQALERLKEAKDGIYLGPLRLLALEVYEKMLEYQVPCTMLTGQECLEIPFSRITAATIEMADYDHQYDIVVIDEAQMTEDPARGHCWTRAILGILAPEIHVCMSPAAEEVVKQLITLCHDTCEVHHYERKTALVCEEQAISFPEDIRPGDALVAFSKKAVLDISGRLEEAGVPTSVIYGSLPPEIRRRQTRMFAEGETSVVAATDAIGMGLNLPVRRIIFVQTDKYDGISRRPLKIPEIKQVAGRAGRYGLYETGYVNAMTEDGLAYISELLPAEEEPVRKVSLGFPQVLLDLEEPLDVILEAWHGEKADPPFEKIAIDELLFLYGEAKKHEKQIPQFADKQALYRMISCPVDIKDRDVVDQWLYYCMDYSKFSRLTHPGIARSGLDSRALTRRKDAEKKQGRGGGRRPKFTLQDYETYYKKLDLYYQFSHRFEKTIDEEWLEQERNYTEGMIMQYLSGGKKGYIARCPECGRILPVGYSFGKCQRCFEKMRRR